MSPATIAIIPARYGSTRLPGKALADIAGRPMVWHVAERARRARGIARVIVATDDLRIRDAVAGAGVEVALTSRTIRAEPFAWQRSRACASPACRSTCSALCRCSIR